MKHTNDDCVRVMIVDDHPVVRMGLRSLLEEGGGIRVTAEAGTADEAIRCLNADVPDVILVDISLKGSANGIELTKSITVRYPEVPILILSIHDEEIYAERAIRAGAKGYVMKEIAPESIQKAVRTVVAGDLYLSEPVMKKILARMSLKRRAQNGSPVEQLSDREFEIFCLFGSGYSVKDISQKLNISIYTVETHRRTIKRKLQLHDSSALIRHAVQWILMNNGSGCAV